MPGGARGPPATRVRAPVGRAYGVRCATPAAVRLAPALTSTFTPCVVMQDLTAQRAVPRNNCMQPL